MIRDNTFVNCASQRLDQPAPANCVIRGNTIIGAKSQELAKEPPDDAGNGVE